MSRQHQRYSISPSQRKKPVHLSVPPSPLAKLPQKYHCLNCAQALTPKNLPDHSRHCRISVASCEAKLRNFYSFLHTLMAPPISLRSASFYHSLTKNIAKYQKYLKNSNEKQCKFLNQALQHLLQQTRYKHPEYPHLANLITLGQEVLQEIQKKEVSDISVDEQSTNQTSPEFQQDGKQRFYSMTMRKKFKLPKCHPGKKVSIDFIYKNANFLGIQSTRWEEFVDDSFEMYRKFRVRPLFRHKRTRSWFPEGYAIQLKIGSKIYESLQKD